MTLDTKIYLHGQVNVAEFFEFCQRTLLAFDKQARSLDRITWSDEEGWSDKTTRCRANQLGQGLPAILDFTYRPDAPLLSVEQAAEHNDWCNDDGDCDGTSRHDPPHWACVSLDTTYGYVDELRGWRCGDLHAALIRLFGGYLDERGVAFSWMNEFTGEIHDGYNNLEELGASGANAASWFSSVVLPAIKREIGTAEPEAVQP